jgi:hypothetical protein
MISHSHVECKNSSKALFVRLYPFISLVFPSHISLLARPSTDGRVFLEELLDTMKISEQNEDTRTHDELAFDLGFSGMTLSTLSHADPQRTSLRIFNAIFPTNEDKEYLINVANMAATCGQLLQDILGAIYMLASIFAFLNEEIL